MDKDQLFHDRYRLEKLLGRGNFSEVWLARDEKTSISVALKIYAPATGLDDTGLNMFAREFSLVVNANHKNLLKPLYYDSYQNKPYLVLPYCERGSIFRRVGKFTEEEAWRLIRDVASGLSYLHAMKPTVIHQDIKPDNVMVGPNDDFMITDFGVSTHLRSALRKSASSAFSSAGTLAYMAPERFSKDNTPIMANDIYSLGATVYEMISGVPPFGEDGGLMQKRGAETPELQGDYSAQLKKVLTKCLNPEPWRRPTAEQLERYAIDALEGRPIRFVDEKTFWQRFRIPIIAAAVIVIAAAVVGIKLMNDAKVARELAEQAAAEKARIEGLIREFEGLTITADSLARIGDRHEEYYEKSYIDAMSTYNKALSITDQIDCGDSLIQAQGVDEKVNQLGRKLFESYNSFVQKAQLFEDNPEVSDEFNARASSISSRIDITEYVGVSEEVGGQPEEVGKGPID